MAELPQTPPIADIGPLALYGRPTAWGHYELYAKDPAGNEFVVGLVNGAIVATAGHPPDPGAGHEPDPG